MYAKNLQSLLLELCVKSDISHNSHEEFEKRFESLRGSNLLPRGRLNRAKQLSNKQIAHAILSLASAQPGWSSNAAIVLSNLRPVGGKNASFHEGSNLSRVVETLLSDKEARKNFTELQVSLSEFATNSYGFASILYEKGGLMHESFYVPKEASSLLVPGAEIDFDAKHHNSPVSKSTIFNPTFFDRIALSIERALANPQPLMGDGSEYNAEETQAKRLKALGAKRSSNYLNIGVDNQVTWPKHETLITFDGFKIVLLPKTRDHVQSVHVDLSTNRLTVLEASTLVNRLLSLMTWCDDQYAIAQEGWSGNTAPNPVQKRNLAFTTAHHWEFDREIPSSDEVRRALALYREARNAQQNFMVSYAVLNFYKIIEIRNPKKNKFDPRNASNWISRAFSVIKHDGNYSSIINPFIELCESTPPEKYISQMCRNAVAHAHARGSSDPDQTTEIHRLYIAADVIRILARHFIKTELGVSESIYSEE